MRLKALLLSLLFPTTLLAYPVHIVHVLSADNVNTHDAHRILSEAQKRFDELENGIQITSYKFIPRDVRPQLKVYSRQFDRMFFWQLYQIEHNAFSVASTLYLVGAMNCDGSFCIGGMARSICANTAQNYAIANAINPRLTNHLTLRYSAVAVEHEVGHLRGAEHFPGVNIMNADALSLVPTSYPLHFFPVTIDEIASCFALGPSGGGFSDSGSGLKAKAFGRKR